MMGAGHMPAVHLTKLACLKRKVGAEPVRGAHEQR